MENSVERLKGKVKNLKIRRNLEKQRKLEIKKK